MSTAQCPRCQSVHESQPRFCSRCGYRLDLKISAFPQKNGEANRGIGEGRGWVVNRVLPDSKSRIAAGIAALVVACVAVTVWALSPKSGPEAGGTAAYKNPNGESCTGDDWSRQFLQGLKPGEAPCRQVAFRGEAIRAPVTPESRYIDRCRDVHSMTYRKPISQLSQRDIDQISTCKALGAYRE